MSKRKTKIDANIARFAKAQGKTITEVELDAARTFAKMHADEAERLRQQLTETTAEAFTDISSLAQQVITAKMWTRYEKWRRQQAEQAERAASRQLVKLMDGQDVETTTPPRVRKAKPRKPRTPLTHAGQWIFPPHGSNLLPIHVEKAGLAIVVRKGSVKEKLVFRESGRQLLDDMLAAYEKTDGWVEMPRQKNGKRYKIDNLFPKPTAALIKHETRNEDGSGGPTGRVRLWVVEK